MQNKTSIDCGNGNILVLSIDIPTEEQDLEGILSINLANLAAELVTIPLLMHKIGVLKTYATNAYNKAKMDLSVFEAKEKKKIREEMVLNKIKPTVDSVDDELVSKSSHRVMRTRMYERQRDMDYMDSLYWSVKEKAEKLSKISNGLQTGDVYDQLVATQLKNINFVNLKHIKPLLK